MPEEAHQPPDLDTLPVTFRAMQRIHADYCGPFLGKFWALVVEDAFSKFPEVYLTTAATAAFTRTALQSLFAREGIPQVLVTDNGTHFSDRALQAWLHNIGCKPATRYLLRRGTLNPTGKPRILYDP